jgi:flagella basal body P-ring formation protein FlgA
VHVRAPALVLATGLPAGTVLEAAHLRMAEVDWAESHTPPVADASLLVGRTLARPMAAGAAARPGDLRPRQWFSAGETVRISARGRGFAVSGEAQALSNGIEGQSARLRTEGGRIVSGMPVGVRLVEVAL